MTKIGRTPEIVRDTKLNKILVERGMSRKQFAQAIQNTTPGNPMSADSISRIVNGRRDDYLLSTVYRMCKALSLTPNDILDFEDKV
jgi:DNA-binding Xre family transcriptional regulator